MLTHCLPMPGILVIKTENLQQPIQMHISENPTTFCQYFIAFLESTSTLEHFARNFEPHSLSISEIIHSKGFGALNR